jgi:ATP-dependent RNA helicase DDX51/DBP6
LSLLSFSHAFPTLYNQSESKVKFAQNNIQPRRVRPEAQIFCRANIAMDRQQGTGIKQMFLAKRFDPGVSEGFTGRKRRLSDAFESEAERNDSIEVVDDERAGNAPLAAYQELADAGDHQNDNADDDDDNDDDDDDDDDKLSSGELQVDPRHASILERFRSMVNRVGQEAEARHARKDALRKRQTKQNKENEEAQKDEEEEEEEDDTVPQEEFVTTNELVPLPQIESKHAKRERVDVADWMTKPTYIPIDATKRFSELGLSPRMVKTLDSLGYTSSFAVQTGVVPVLFEDSKSISPDPLPDVLVNAYTGSGKTLAYGIPIVEALSSRVVPRIRALIIVPTKPLIQQVRTVMESLCKGTSLKVVVCRNERSFKDEQKLLASNPADILITTPGRLVDHVRNTPEFQLNHLRYLVIDEADRLLNQSFQEWVDVLMDALTRIRPSASSSSVWYRPPQKLVFSATLTRDPGKLASLKIGFEPRIFIIGDDPATNDQQSRDVDYEFTVPGTLTEVLYSVKNVSTKPLALVKLLQEHAIRSDCIIFVKSNQAAARLSRLIALIDEELFHMNLVTDRCSGELEISQRRRKLRQFADREIGILVCTDLIARGIDIASVKYVINYDMPVGKREYVHRVGRTARAGNTGIAWNIVCGSGERNFFWSMSKSISRKNEVETNTISTDRDMNDGYQKALAALEHEVFATNE